MILHSHPLSLIIFYKIVIAPTFDGAFGSAAKRITYMYAHTDTKEQRHSTPITHPPCNNCTKPNMLDIKNGMQKFASINTEKKIGEWKHLSNDNVKDHLLVQHVMAGEPYVIDAHGASSMSKWNKLANKFTLLSGKPFGAKRAGRTLRVRFVELMKWTQDYGRDMLKITGTDDE